MSKPRLLDLFCCEGGAGAGYWRAGFEVIGVDIAEQPNYPFQFMQADALDVLADLVDGRSRRFPSAEAPRLPVATRNAGDFDAIHASPPCQGYLNLSGVNRALGRAQDHELLIAKVRGLLVATGLPYVIENVPDASSHLCDPVRLCGSSFGLPLRRHRLFECSFPVLVPPCDHSWQTEKKYWTGWRPNGEHRLSTVVQIYGNAGGKEHWPAALGVDWMSDRGMSEAIPPAYTEHIGRQLFAHLEVLADAA